MPLDSRNDKMGNAVESSSASAKKSKLGVASGVYVPTVLNILSILMFLRFGSILGRIGLLGILGLLVVAYFIDLVTALSLSAIASNGEVKGGGAYYLISRSLGPEFGGSIGVLFYLSQVLNTAMNVVGLIDCLKLNLGSLVPDGYWQGYLMQTCALVVCTALCFAGSAAFSRASNGLLAILAVAILSIPISAIARSPFKDDQLNVEFTGLSSQTLLANLHPNPPTLHHTSLDRFRELFGILFPATSGIFAGASMSGDLLNPSKAIPKGTLWAMFSTLILYLLVILSMAASVTKDSLLLQTNVISITNVWSPLILAGECAVTFFSALMGLVGSAKLLQALARDRLLPGLSVFGLGTKRGDEPINAVLITYAIAQLAFFADLNQIATLISMGYQMTFFVMNLACFLLKIGSAPNFRPAFKFFNWQSAFVGSILSAVAMFFIDETYAASAICLLVFLFLLIHYLSPPKHWGDVSQNLIYHQVRKYLLRLKPEHIKFWRPQIILLINDPRHHTRLIQFCNSMKKGSLYILGHVIVTDDFNTGIHEAKLQQAAWTKYITEYSRIKAFVQLTMSPSIEWGVRNLILSAGLGGMRPNIAILGFYNMDELRRSRPLASLPEMPISPLKAKLSDKAEGKRPGRRRGDTSARLLEGFLPTDAIRTEGLMSVTSYMTIVEDLAHRHRLNVAIGKNFQSLETPRQDGANMKKYIDLWPIQMSAEITAQGKSVRTTNFDTYTLILQLGYILSSVPNWKQVFQLRILVFVEYENEVDQEKARLKALLDKLRIQAEVHVFWLASGELTTYENIVNGKIKSQENDFIVNQLLKDNEWWQELQRIRQETAQMSLSAGISSLEDMLEASRRRGSNPRIDNEDGAARFMNLQHLLELPKKPTVSKIAKLGVNFGIHTQHLESKMLDEQVPQQEYYYSEDEDGASSSSSDADFNEVLSEGDAEDIEPSRRPLLHVNRRRSLGDIQSPQASRKSDKARGHHSRQNSGVVPSGYGTMSSSIASLDKKAGQTASVLSPSAESSQTLTAPSLIAESTSSSSRKPRRSGHSRQASINPNSATRSSDAKTAGENGTGPSISFCEPEGTRTPRPERPPMSRASSMGRFSSRPVPETKVENDDGGGQRLTFAEPEAHPHDMRSRRNSASQSPFPDLHLDIPELLEAYEFGASRETDARSTYSAQSLPLSFNDLPSRAQHLILNELMRQNSGDSAVILTTLPIPEEGTSKNDDASFKYLSDIEVLCHELPPVLLVLSNNMTVTVSL
ncbi:solute carrier family 12 protein [Apiospora marii]|uniref:Solute carrier family 12 protein n=1 Tax=Apiospora marii TaxID=335849 RepID=A0ABR1R3M0_9PEZI